LNKVEQIKIGITKWKKIEIKLELLSSKKIISKLQFKKKIFEITKTLETTVSQAVSQHLFYGYLT